MNLVSKVFVGLLGILLAVSGAEAATYRVCKTVTGTHPIRWNGDDATMYISTTSMPIGSAWDRKLQNAINEWNSIGGSNFTFYVGRDTDGTHNHKNKKNEIYFARESTALATTYSRYTCYWALGTHTKYVEADISFNSGVDWTILDFTGSDFGKPYNFSLVGIHELGHALGLLHQNDRLATMNAYYPNGGPLGHYHQVEPHGDDRYGLHILYGDSTTERDVAVSRFRSTLDGKTTRNSTPASTSRGTSYDFYYTLENFGTQRESATVSFYLSTNNYISTADTYVGSTTWSIGARHTVSATKTITIPSTLTPGTYYFGYIVDAGNVIPESDENNNSVSLLSSFTVY